MKVTFFSFVMSVLWSSLLIVLYSILRKRRRLIDVCSVSGIFILYVFCVIRMTVPVEFNKVKVVNAPAIYNPVYRFLVQNDLPWIGIKPYRILILLWIIATVIILVVQAVRYIRFKKTIDSLEKYGSVIDGEKYGVNDTGVTIIKTISADTPFSFGIIRKMIIIPDKIYSEYEIRLMLKHEYMHLKNHDLVIQLMIHFLCAVFWWNPFVYLLRFDIEQCFEIRCDRCVTAGMARENAADYLSLLLKVYKDGNSEGYEAWHGMRLAGFEKDRRNNIKERFALIEAGFCKKDRNAGKIIAALISGMVLILSYTFIFQSKYEAPTEECGANMREDHENTPENTYIKRMPDGRYILYDDYGAEDEISESSARMFQNSGFKIYEEGGSEY